MAVNASRVSSGRGPVIDLTLTDDDEDDGVPYNDPIPQPRLAKSRVFPTSGRLKHGFNFTTTAIRPLRLTDSRSSSTSTPQDIPPPFLPSPNSIPPHNHPTKRRKLQHGSDSKPASPFTDKETLEKCLQIQVFPHLERAIKKVDKEVFDVDRLGGSIIYRIADSEFERQFRNGNGRVPPNVEASVIVRIHELVAQLVQGPEFRRIPSALPPAPVAARRENTKQPPTSVLPSIEHLPDASVPNRDGEDDGDDEEEDIYEDIDESEAVGRQLAQTPPPQVPRKKKPPITPQQLRTRVKATQWQSGKSYEYKKEGSPVQAKNRWFGLSSRPYLPVKARHQIVAGVSSGRLFRLRPDELREPNVYHVDFSGEEIRFLRQLASSMYGRSLKTERSDMRELRHLLKKSDGDIKARLLDVHGRRYSTFQQPPSSLLKRSTEDLQNFLDDLHHRQVDLGRRSFYLGRDDTNIHGDAPRKNLLPSLLLAREIVGHRLGAARRYQNFNETFRSNREDYIEPKVEWTNCAGDIMTISWLSDATRFVCGTTTHSDSHNQQYNKPGNLLFGDASSNTLRAYPDHRIPRPLVAHGDNALDSMRESQDPWLYTSVVSSDYDPVHDFVFTSSFDNTVKVWHSRDGSMALRETWHHEGRVNFVLTNKNKCGSKVATAADVPTRAVRVYHAAPNESTRPMQDYTYDEYSCKRVHGEDYIPSDKWAYFPSAIRWGLEPSVNHLLLIGYSPRSLNGDDNEIPEDKRDTGELCLWDTNTNTELKVNSAATANVFEVVWHPTRQSFAAATSASQTSEKIEEHIRTQIRLFELNEATGQYGVVKTLDCPAIDINELSIRPNSTLYSYFAASCTDGKVYVWDSSGSDHPMCVLEHGDPVEEIIGDREHEDVGVKFTAWATTTDRLYTGSSDGIIKVWNIRHGKGTLIRDLIEVPAPITAGAFSPDFKRLLIGDGSGRVYLMDIDDDDEDKGDQNSLAAASSGFLRLQLNGKQRAIRRPRPFIPHDEVPPPGQDEDSELSDRPRYQAGQERAQIYLDALQLTIHPDPTIGVVQGPLYPETGLYRAEAHVDGDVEAPLLGGFQHQQRVNQIFSRTTRLLKQDNVDELPQALCDELHKRNAQLDFDAKALDPETRLALVAERAELEASPLDLDYESSGYDED